jgi:hypothetical protein
MGKKGQYININFIFGIFKESNNYLYRLIFDSLKTPINFFIKKFIGVFKESNINQVSKLFILLLYYKYEHKRQIKLKWCIWFQ